MAYPDCHVRDEKFEPDFFRRIRVEQGKYLWQLYKKSFYDAAMNSIRVLKTFVAVAETGSFTAAAERIALTPAAVGAQIKGLETEMGRNLFVRDKRGASLTPAGMALVPRALRLLQDYEELSSSVAKDGALSGSVTVGAISSAMASVAKTLARLKLLYPSLSITILNGQQSELESKVVLGELDAAIYVQSRTPEHRGTAWVPLYNERVMFAVGRRVVGRRAEVIQLLKTQPYLRFDHQSLTGAQIERVLHRMGLHLTPFLELNSLAAIMELVRHDVGVSVLPVLRDSKWESDKTVQLLPLPGRKLHRGVGVLHTTRRAHLMNVLIHYLVRDLKEPESAGASGQASDYAPD